MTSKDLEREYFRRFAQARPDLDLELAVESEAPDFIVHRGPSLLGIEITRYSPSSRRAGFIPEEQESLRERVMTRSREWYYAQGGLPLHVAASFDDQPRLERSRVDALATGLAKLLLTSARDVLVYRDVALRLAGAEPYLPELGGVSAFRVPTPEHGVWYAGEGAWVRHATETDLERVIVQKERKLPAYRTRCSDVWLLIVFDTMPGGEYVQGPPVDDPITIRSAFDRVFALERISSRCVEVAVDRTA